MKTFKNINFTKRDSECTNVVFCQSKIAPNQNWIEVDQDQLLKTAVDQLFIENGVRYFGYL